MNSQTPFEAVVAMLQRRLLEAVLTRGPLPGAERPISLPDLEFLLRQPEILVLDENLPDPATIEAVTGVRVVDGAAIADRAAARGEIVYLYFAPAQRGVNEVSLTLELRIAAPPSERRPLGLSGLQVRFRERNGDWVADDSTLFAA